MAAGIELPQPLQAERAGRALALSIVRHAQNNVQPAVTVKASTGLPGAAALCAARHLSNLGIAVSVTLEDYNAHTLDVFAQALEVVGCMDLPMTQADGATGMAVSATNGIVIDGTAYAQQCSGFETTAAGATKTLSAAAFLSPLHSEQWDGFSLQANPFVQTFAQNEAVPARSVAGVRKIDEASIHDYGLAGLLLMENAATGAVAVASDFLDKRGLAADASTQILILAGTGNNGGDALAMARGLRQRGYDLTVALCGSEDRFSPDAAVNLSLLRAAGVMPRQSSDLDLAAQVASCALVIDGLFGTGLVRAVEGELASLIQTVNATTVPVLALDIPSGVHGDTGEVMGTAIHADATVTFAAVKPGLLKNQDACGALFLASIGCPAELLR